jgi:hypothetical protein
MRDTRSGTVHPIDQQLTRYLRRQPGSSRRGVPGPIKPPPPGGSRSQESLGAAQKKYLAAWAKGTAQPPVKRQRPMPSLEPISRSQAKQYATHPHPSTQSVRANIIARAAFGKLGPDIARSRRVAPGPAVSGYNFLSGTVGRNVGALVPGTLTRAGRRPHATPGGVAKDLLQDIPWIPASRIPRRLVYRGLKGPGGRTLIEPGIPRGASGILSRYVAPRGLVQRDPAPQKKARHKPPRLGPH